MRGGLARLNWSGWPMTVAVVLAGALVMGGCDAPPPPVEPDAAGAADAETAAGVEGLAEPQAEPEGALEPQAEPEPAIAPTAAPVEPEPTAKPVVPKPAPKPTVAAVPAEPPATTTTTERTGEIPADHIKDRDGVMHKKGSSKAWERCTPCHGKDLKGQDNRPSCYQCHDNEWDDDD